MPGNARLDLVFIGLHADAADFNTVPSALLSVDAADFRPTHDYERLRSDSQRGDGKMRESRKGKVTAEIPSLKVPLRGCKSGGAGDGVSSGAGVNNKIADVVLQAAFGQVASASSGETSDASDAGMGAVVTADASSSFTAGDCLVVKSTAGNRWNARQVVSVATADVTVDRALLNDGAADTAKEGEVIYAMDVYAPAWAVSKHKHLGVKYSKDDGSVEAFWGCLPSSLELDFPAGGDATATLAGLGFTEHNRDESAGSYAAVAEGEEVVVFDSPFFVGALEYFASGVKVSVALATSPRPANGSRNGNAGFVVSEKAVKVTAKILVGSLSREAAETLVETWRGAAQDVGMQHGDTPGGISYMRVAAANTVSAKTSVENGQRIITWVFEVTRSSAAEDFFIALG